MSVKAKFYGSFAWEIPTHEQAAATNIQPARPQGGRKHKTLFLKSQTPREFVFKRVLSSIEHRITQSSPYESVH